MRQSTFIIFFMFGIIGQLALSDDGIYFPNNKLTRDVTFGQISPRIQAALSQVSKGAEAFSFELFTYLARAVENINYDFVISPFSIWCLLVLLTEGTSGETYNQLQRTLHLPQDIDTLRSAYQGIQKLLVVNTPTVEIAVNQALFADLNRPLSNDYVDTLVNHYNADVNFIPFVNIDQSYNIINNHIKHVTRGKIEKVVEYSDLQDAQMILLSALFFKGQWTKPFNASLTQEQPFYDESGKTVIDKVNMMYQQGKYKYAAIPELKSYVAEIPYGKEDRLCMLVLLPQIGTRVSNVFERLSKYSIKQIITELHRYDNNPDEEEPDVDLYIPRFNINTELNLNIILEQMGIRDLFNAARANFSRATSHNVYVSRVIHKTVIKVDEEGTVAASATGASVIFKQQPSQFLANRPFGFMIIERATHSVLFTGQIRRPGKV